MSSTHESTDHASPSSPPLRAAPSNAKRAFGRDPAARARSRASVDAQLNAQQEAATELRINRKPKPEPEPAPEPRLLATDAQSMKIRAALWDRIAVFAPGVPGPGGLTNRELEDLARANALARIQAALWRRVTPESGEFDDRWLARDIAAALRACGMVAPDDLLCVTSEATP